MKFWIITPTHNRYDILKRNIKSVQDQSYNNFIHIIIDDSTNNETFENIKKDCPYSNILYLKNSKNSWVNFSRNRWLDVLSNDIDYIIFLDDDDYFDKDTLKKAKEVIERTNKKWLVSNRKNITKISEYNQKYNYLFDYFLWDEIGWDTTHVIHKDAVKNIRFSKMIKQWEEWVFFVELWNKYNFYTYNFDSTISEYLEWWLTNNAYNKKNWYIHIIYRIIAVFEFFFLRKVKFTNKLFFLKKAVIFLFKKK